MINKAINTNKVPVDWKKALVTPLFKGKGMLNDLNNYRGISVLSLINKLFEKICASQIRDYFVMGKLLYSGQHGLRAGHSCETALHEIISPCLANLDNKAISLLLFVDFKQDFDMVDSNLLLIKLLSYGFSNNAVDLIRN